MSSLKSFDKCPHPCDHHYNHFSTPKVSFVALFSQSPLCTPSPRIPLICFWSLLTNIPNEGISCKWNHTNYCFYRRGLGASISGFPGDAESLFSLLNFNSKILSLCGIAFFCFRYREPAFVSSVFPATKDFHLFHFLEWMRKTGHQQTIHFRIPLPSAGFKSLCPGLNGDLV